jgi:uncharacterized RDD family membrane protein YckC
MSPRVSSLSIETPEGVVFSFELATPVARALAWAVDATAIGCLAYGAGKLAQIAGAVDNDLAVAISVGGFFAISIAYGVVLEWRWRGQTIGKRLLGLRVIDARGLRLHFPQIVLRNLLRLVDALPLLYLVGGITCFFSRNGQRLGDLAANTIVVSHQKAVASHRNVREANWAAPNLDLIASATDVKYNSLQAYPHMAARLRSQASPEAVGLALRAIAGRERYSPLARVELFRDLALYFQSLVKFPGQAVESLTDEQYVRSVLRVIYARTS